MNFRKMKIRVKNSVHATLHLGIQTRENFMLEKIEYVKKSGSDKYRFWLKL